MRAAFVLLALLAQLGCTDEGPWEGPFGTKPGLAVADIERFAPLVLDKSRSVEGKAYVYESRQAPISRPSAKGYTYVFGKKAGLCSVSASLTAEDAESLEKETSGLYGAPVVDDEWTRAWRSNTHIMGDGLNEITILISTVMRDIAGGAVAYVFIPYSECK